MCAYVKLADEENGVPEVTTEDISSKLSTLPSQPPPGLELQCLKTQTEGATAKVINSPHTHLFYFLFSADTFQFFTIITSIAVKEYRYVYIQVPVSEWESQEQHLLEMFPKCSLSEARSALSIAKGDMEEAVRLIIEGDVQLSPTPLNVSLSNISKIFSASVYPA